MPATQDQALTILKRRFSLWRLHRARGTHIPEDLWQAAIDAARKYGIWRVAEKLRVDCDALKRRLEKLLQAATGAKPPTFIEIPAKILPSSPRYVVELQDREGLRLRVELRDAVGAETLAQALWKERR